MEVSTEGISGMFDGFIACTDKTASFKQIMSAIKCGSREIFIDGMDLEVFEGIDGC
jgi:hypothetical protein